MASRQPGADAAAGGAVSLDIDDAAFDCAAYQRKVLQEENLQQLMDREHQLTQQMKTLDLDMQTLVYENYNKFIAATDTVRSMRKDFTCMEDEMKKLMDTMQVIIERSSALSDGLVHKRREVERLSRMKSVIARLKFLFRLPSTLQSFIDAKEYGEAVDAYLENKDALERFKDMPALRTLYSETNATMANLKDTLLDSFQSRILSGQELVYRVHLLLKLGEQPSALANDYLTSSLSCLRRELCAQGEHVGNDEPFGFVDQFCSNILGNVSLLVTSWRSMFPELGDNVLMDEVSKLLVEYVSHCKRRFFDQPLTPSQNGIPLGRALDRFYRRLLALEKVLTLNDEVRDGAMELIGSTAERHVHLMAESVEASFERSLQECKRHIVQGRGLAAPTTVGDQEGSSGRAEQPLASAIAIIEPALIGNIKSGLAYLLHLTSPDLSYILPSGMFPQRFAAQVKRDFFIAIFQRILNICEQYSTLWLDRSTASATMVLVVCKFCCTCAGTFLDNTFDMYDRHFLRKTSSPQAAGNCEDRAGLKGSFNELSRSLLHQFVMLEGFQLSQMLERSAETRDWMANVEPRSVRSVIKRVLEDLGNADSRVGQLFEEGVRKELNSDSSRRTSGANYSRNLRTWNASAMDSGGFGSTFGRLWNDRVEYAIQVDFTKMSIMTAIVKICLKTLLEVVRLKTYGKYGLQQVQTDCHYFQLHAWRFVSDESMMITLLDEVVSSAVQRCIDPELMDPALVTLICEREARRRNLKKDETLTLDLRFHQDLLVDRKVASVSKKYP